MTIVRSILAVIMIAVSTMMLAQADVPSPEQTMPEAYPAPINTPSQPPPPEASPVAGYPAPALTPTATPGTVMLQGVHWIFILTPEAPTVMAVPIGTLRVWHSDSCSGMIDDSLIVFCDTPTPTQTPSP